MTQPLPLDLRFGGRERVIASYLLETPEGLALFDPGPESCLATLRRRLAERGRSFDDVGHLLLSHIHFDHAGATGAIVRDHPHIAVHVSPVGAPHLAEPERLEASARRLYGDAFDALWGEIVPVPEANLLPVGDAAAGLEAFATPGHASHHVCFLTDDGTLLAGDAAGVRIQPGRTVLPPTPPPDVDVEAWERTLDEIERRAPARLALVHFGFADDVGPHLDRLRERLRTWAERVRDGADERSFAAAAEAELAHEPERDAYAYAMPFAQSHAGLERYWKKRAAAA